MGNLNRIVSVEPNTNASRVIFNEEFLDNQGICIEIKSTAIITSTWIWYMYKKVDGTWTVSSGFHYEDGLIINETVKELIMWVGTDYPITAAGEVSIMIMPLNEKVVRTQEQNISTEKKENRKK